MKKFLLPFTFALFMSWNFMVFADEPLQEITIPAGETLWSISNKYLKDPKKWPEIVKHNPQASSDPTIPIAGTRIRIPVMLIKEEYQNAQLIKSIPDVQFKRKKESDWHNATLNMLLHYDDSLRTMQGGQAHVRFPTREVVQINENSYVVLRPEKILQEVQLLKGDIRASRAKVITPRGAVIKPSSAKADFQAKIREDETEVVFVYKGKVDVTAQGKTVTVPEGYGTQVPKSAPPLDPKPLPSFPDFNPAELTVSAPDLNQPNLPSGKITITPPTEKKSTGSNSKSIISNNVLVNYKIQLSKTADFKSILLEKIEEIGTPFDIKKQNLPDGLYYMRVAFLDALGSLGSFSQPSQVYKDSVSPILKNLVPTEGQKFSGEESYCDVIGDVEGATMLSIENEVVFISPTGRFSKFIYLKKGENVINILARDAQGNETKIARKVYYQP